MNIKVYPIVLSTEDIIEPLTVRIDAGVTKGMIKEEVGHRLRIDMSDLEVISTLQSSD